MRTACIGRWSLVTFVLGLLIIAPTLSHGQFVAVNGQAAGPGLGTNSTTWNVFGNLPGSSGALKDVYSGAVVGVQVGITANGAVTASAGGGSPSLGTPLYDTFSGFVSFPGADAPGALARIGATTTVTYTFTGLSQQKLYNFKASVVGGGTESTSPQQWSQFQIDGASAFTNAHTTGCYTNGLAVNQAAVNTGVNTNGDMVVWEGIVPDTNGSFSVTCSQYNGLIPGGGTANGPYGYALSVFSLEEVNPGIPRVISVSGTGDSVDLVFSLPIAASATNLANYALTNLYGPVAVLSAAFGTNDQSIRLTTGRQLPFMTHWINIGGIVDAATGTNVIAPDSQITFTNVAFTTGYSMTEIYRGIAGTTISALTNSANYPAHPSLTEYFPYSYWFDPAVGANYGGRLSGFLVPSVSGDYDFHFYTMQGYNAACLLSLGTNEDPATRIPIADRLNPSGPITLVGGQHYYFEALVKEGTGASDFVYVEWKQPGSDTWSIIWGEALGNYLAPPGAKIAITQQPADASVYDGREATFTVATTNNSKIVSEPTYQWQANGVDIPGATQPSYITPRLYETNSGVAYRVLVVIPGAARFSSNALLTVTKDLVPPAVVRVLNFGTEVVELLFSEPVDPASALDLSNYSFVNSLPITGVTLDSSQTTVTLTTGPLVYGSNYSIMISGIRDQAVVPNTIPANTLTRLLPTRAISQDVGAPSIASVTTNAGNGLNLLAAGREIGGTNDQFSFNYQSYAGDFDVELRVVGLSPSDIWAKAGLMARESLAQGSRFAASLVTPSINGTSFEYREGTNALANRIGNFPANYPDTWLRLQRSGNVFEGYASYDGHTWTTLGGTYFTNVPALLYVGLAVSSHNSNQVTVAEFRDLGRVGPDAVIGTVENSREALGPSSRKTPIVFSEIMYKPVARTDGKNLEYLEIYNSAPWFHDLSGYRIIGDALSYSFPSGTIIPGGGFLVIAASTENIQTAYGIENVLGPYTGSLKRAGTVQLLDEQGAVLLTVPYSNLPPWPVAADGAGHSLVLANPSYGEEDPRAWDISTRIGGSPGEMDSFSPNPLSKVVINEFLAHTENPNVADFIELYNHSGQTNDLSGCILTDDPAVAKFTIPLGTFIFPGGFVSFDQSQMGFALKASGETLYLFLPDRSRVLDAVRFEAQADGVSFGRWPDGANDFYPLSSSTPGMHNGAILIGDIVINELMYHPISGSDDDQYIELYNRGTNVVSLANWQFIQAVNFVFPTNVAMAPGSYLVVGRNLTNLLARYPNLNNTNAIGNLTGRLSHNGERVVLTRPEVLNGTNTIDVVEDEVTYSTGGNWGQWSSGGGSSLELIDPRSNHRLAANWADSDDTKKSTWTTIEATGVMDLGNSYGSALSYAQLGPLDVGECLVDDVEVHAGTAGVNLVKNPGFEAGGLVNWWMQGCMVRSSLENTGYGGIGHSLHVRCSSRIWTGVNSCQLALNSGLVAGQTATLRFKARWLHGWPEIVLRLKGNYLEAVGTMPIPANLGTPGAPNSRLLSNAGPAIYDVRHTPSIPSAQDSVVVTAKVHDPDGIKRVTLNYRIDPGLSYTTVPMEDTGTNGDAIAGDHVLSAIIPSQYYQAVVAFYISATDVRGTTNRFPALVKDNAPVRECLVMFGDQDPGGSFGSYHLWLSQTNQDRWSGLPNLSNEMIDGTFVNGKRVIYNMTGRFAGSPYHQDFYSPQYSQCHFKWVFPDDDKFLGATSFNKIHSPGNYPGDDDSLQREQIANTFLRTLGVPWLNRRYVTVFVNGQQNVQLMEDTQCPDADMVKEYFPNDSNGYLYKMQPWFEFVPQPSGSYIDFNNVAWCTVLPYTTTGRVKKTARYRYNFMVRSSPDSLNNFDNVFSLIDAASAPNSPNYAANLEGIADMENWMRVFAANHAAGNWDSFGTQNGQNLYGYIGTESTKYSLMMFDFNIVLGNSSSWGPGENLFNASDSNLGRMYSNPTFRRMYIRALQELVDGPLDVANAGPLIDAKYATFIANGLSVTKPSTLKSWLTSARRSIASQIASATNAPFSVNPTVVISNEVAVMSGLAPVKIKTIQFDGVEWPLTWTSVTAWTAMVPLKPGTNLLSIVGLERHGQPVPGAINQVPVVYDGMISSPIGKVIINEIMYAPAAPNGQYLELYNNSSNVTFNLSGWELPGLGYTFPAGSLIKPNGFLVLAANRTAFAAAYGATNPVFGTFSQPLSASGQILTLVQPTGNGIREVVTEVRYENVPPWPGGANGTGKSLQLIDPQQDNWRVANWTANSAPTPGSINTASTNLPAFPPLWLNEMQADNLTGITNNAGQLAPWVEIYNPSVKPVSLDGICLTSSYTNLTEWAFPSGTVIKPGEYKVIFADGQTNLTTSDEMHASFTLPSGSGSLALSQLDTNNQPQVLDYANYINVSPNHSYGSFPDGQSFDRQEFLYATPGGTNDNSGNRLTVAINEWMAANTFTMGDPVTGKFEDWFELYNYGDQPMDLTGYFLTHSLTNQFEFSIPAGYVIPPHGFLLVWADKQDTNSTPDLHTNFKLSKSGTSIGLYAANGRPVDFVAFGPQSTDLSMGRYPDGGASIYFLPVATPRARNAAPNTAPVLQAEGDLYVFLGQSLTFLARASDTDQPPQTLSFSLGTGVPKGATINATSGLFSWTPTSAPTTNWINIIVTDNGVPSLSAAQPARLIALPPPTLSAASLNGNLLSFTWPAAVAHSYQLESTEDLVHSNWTAFGSPVTGTGTSLTLTNALDLSTNRYFRLRLLP